MIMDIVGQIVGFAGSLCLLLFGMNMLSNGIQKGAGSGLKKLVSKITKNRFYAILTGLGVTAFVQSSGATTVMVVSFVNAEILALEQAIGVIFGANIGTTATAWIVSLFGFNFSISAAAVPLFGFGFVLKYFKRFKIHNFADCFMGFALLFMGLGLLKESLELGPAAAKLFVAISDWKFWGLIVGVLLGVAITALIHSSSAMTAIVLTMAANGTLSWKLSAAIVLGSNIGSTVDAVMSSFGASTNAKRAAFVHVAFNVAGTLLALSLFNPFLSLVDLIVPGAPEESITTHISMLHTVFNVCATLLFAPFVNQIASLVRKIIPESKVENDSHYHFPAILPHSGIIADLYSVQIHAEVSKMAAKVMDMFDSVCSSFSKPENSGKVRDEVESLANYIEEMNSEISEFLQKCLRLPNANSLDRAHFSKLMHITESLAALAEETGSLMHTAKKFIDGESYDSDDERTKEIVGYLEVVRGFFELACTFITVGIIGDGKVYGEAFESKIDETKHSLKKASRKRIENGSDVKTELRYIGMVRKIERAGDCVWSIVQSV